MSAALPKGYKRLVEEALAEVVTLSVAEAALLHGRPGYCFVDLREKGELLREGTIPKSLHTPRGMLEFWVDPDSPYFKADFAGAPTLVLFCAGGWRSALAAKTLQDMGLEEVCHIEGGFDAWRQAGRPVDSVSVKKGAHEPQ